jgi:hypothetical protein
VSGERVAVRTYRACTRLYPSRFRTEYGADLVALFRDQCRDEPLWRVLSRVAVDLAITIPSQHLETNMRRSNRRLVPFTYIAVAAGGLLLALVGGTTAATMVIGLGIALAAGTIGVVAWRRAAPVHDRSLGANWWKYLVAGPCLIALVIVAAGAGVESWFLGMACVLIAFVLTAVGLVLGLAQLFNRRPRGVAA